jgi:hypothetical protein
VSDYSRRPFTVAHVFAATLGGPVAILLKNVWERGGLQTVLGALVGVAIGVTAARIPAHRRRLQMALAAAGVLGLVPLLIASALPAPRGPGPALSAGVGLATIVATATCPATSYRRLGWLCVLAAGVLGGGLLFPHGPAQWAVCAVGAGLFFAHWCLSPEDWRLGPKPHS